MSLSAFTRLRPISYIARHLTIAILLASTVVMAAPASAELSKLLLPDLGSFHQTGSVRPLTALNRDLLRPDYFPANPDPKSPPIFVAGEADYVSSAGQKLLVELVRFQTDSEAFSLLTLELRKMDAGTKLKTDDVGTASVTGTRTVAFFKGTVFARVSCDDLKQAGELARSLAASIDKGEDDLPVLVKHLPDWPSARPRAIYATSVAVLREEIPKQAVFDVVSFDGGAEAVIANYGQSQLVIVEFTTPQFSIENDSRIWTEIAELKSKGEPTPTAYRRVGNYSVFVFNAPDEKTANALVEQVKYEQVVQWLGDDPHLYERLQRYFAETSAGVLIAVLKSSGLSLLLCLAAGALIGTMLFRHRRAQKAAAYSDAGGSIRLNLDDLTGPANTKRLLKSGSSPEQTPSKS